MKPDVLVVGGGVAGLAAATRLAEGGARVVLLEAAPTAGGRARSWTDPATGDVVDNGQHLLMGCYEQTLALLDRIGTRDRVRFQERLQVQFVGPDGEGGTIDCPRLPGAASLLAGLAGYRGIGIGDRVGIVHLAWGLGRAAVGEDESVSALLARHGQSDRARRGFWDPLVLAALNERPEIASSRALRVVLERGLLAGTEASRLGWAVVGLSDLYAPGAARYLADHGGVLRVSSPVTSVAAERGGVSVELRGGERLDAGAIVLALPPDALARLLPDRLVEAPALRERISGLAPSPIVSVCLWLDRPVLEGLFVGLLGTTMQWLFNKGEMLGLPRGGRSYLALVASGARREIEQSPEDLVALALADLRALFPAARRANLLHALAVKERAATISPAVGWDALRPREKTSLPEVVLAGDWTATGLPATIESAALSGHRAAAAILGR